MEIKVKFLVRKRLPAGDAFYWEPSKDLIEAGFKRQGLGKVEAAAMARARELNAEAEAWRQAKAIGTALAPSSQKTVRDAIAAYKASGKYARLGVGTKVQYDMHLRFLDTWSGDAPLRAIDRPLVQKFYHSMQSVTPAKANMTITIGGILFKFARNSGWCDGNPFSHADLVPTAARLRVWSPSDLALFVEASDRAGEPSIGDALILAVYTAQRQGDLLALSWKDFKGGRVRLRQTKRRAQIDLRLHSHAVARLAETQARRSAATVDDDSQPIICRTSGRRWHNRVFQQSFADIRLLAAEAWRLRYNRHGQSAEACPFDDLWFSDLRDTAITRLGTVGCTIPEICAISGHTERSASRILKHYLSLNIDMADRAMDKLEAGAPPSPALPAPASKAAA